MKATSYNEAWTMAREIFPTPMQKDERSSKTAGYSVYRSTDFDRFYCYICDLGDRLEINLDDGRTINIWIKPEEEEAQELQTILEANTAAQKFGAITPAFRITNRIYLEFAIDGDYSSNENESRIYNGLKVAGLNAYNIIWELAAAYCKANNIQWATMEAPKLQHYNHGKKDTGHYIAGIYITTKAEMERETDEHPTRRTPYPAKTL